LAAAEVAHAVENAVFLGRGVVVEPLGEDVFHGVGQAEDDVIGEGGAGLGGGRKDGGEFVIGEAGKDGRDHDADGDAGGGEFADGAEPGGGARGAGFEFAGEIGVEGGDRNVDGGGGESREFAKDVDVAGDEGVFGDDGDGLAEFGADLEAGARDLELAFAGLVAVGDAAHGNAVDVPALGGEFGAQQGRGAEFHHDAGFEIEAAAEAEVFVRGPGEAVGATVIYDFMHCSSRRVSS